MNLVIGVDLPLLEIGFLQYLVLAAEVGQERLSREVEHRARSGGGDLIQHQSRGVEPASHVGAVVGVADDGVEVGQVLDVVVHRPRGLLDPGPDHRRVQRRDAGLTRSLRRRSPGGPARRLRRAISKMKDFTHQTLLDPVLAVEAPWNDVRLRSGLVSRE